MHAVATCDRRPRPTPLCRSLRVRGAVELTDAGLALLAEAPCAGGMHTLDLSFCTRYPAGVEVGVALL